MSYCKCWHFLFLTAALQKKMLFSGLFCLFKYLPVLSFFHYIRYTDDCLSVTSPASISTSMIKKRVVYCVIRHGLRYLDIILHNTHLLFISLQITFGKIIFFRNELERVFDKQNLVVPPLSLSPAELLLACVPTVNTFERPCLGPKRLVHSQNLKRKTLQKSKSCL